MLTQVHPKLPMRNKAATRHFYMDGLGFRELGTTSYSDYLMLRKDNIELHFFAYPELDPAENYGQVYIRTDDIEGLYDSILQRGLGIHPGGPLQVKPWGQKEFAMLDPDNNLLTFGQAI